MNSTIHKINVNLSSVESTDPPVDVPCGTCTLCCQILSPYLTPEEVNSGLYPISLVSPTPDLLARDPQVGPVVTMFKNPQGGCSMFQDGKCTIYDRRPSACRKFDCRKGHHVKTNAVAKEKFGIEL